MNLLPQNDQENIKKERALRFLVVSGIGIFFILLSSLILLLPTYLFLIMQSMELERQLDLEQKSAELYRAENIESAISDLNRQISVMRDNEKILRDPSLTIQSVVKQKPIGMTLSSFTYRKSISGDDLDTLSLSGYADTRDILLDFVEVLENDKSLEGVDSPVSNLLSKDEVEFKLILHLPTL